MNKKISMGGSIIFNKTKQILSNYLVMVAIIVLVIVTMILQSKFASIQNITNIISQLGALSVFSLGMTTVIICGFVDMSMAGVINLVCVSTILLIDPLGQIPALIVGLMLGAVLGFINSRLILSSGATSMYDALFITFGMSTVYSALALIISGGSVIQLRWIQSDYSVFTTFGSGSIGVFSVTIVVFACCLILLHFFLKKTSMGRYISYTGGNKTSAYLAGIPVKRSITLVFMISGLMAALGAIILFSRVTQATPVLGTGYDTNALLAVVVGGTPMKGGKGNVLRTLLGVLLVTLLNNCMNLLGVSPYMQTVMSGFIFIVAICIDNRRVSGVEY